LNVSLLCAFSGRVRVATAVCNVHGGVWPAAACLCFKCVYLFNSSQCCAKRSMAYSSLCSIYTVCLQEPVLHLDVSIYTGFCATPACLSTRALCFTRTCLPTKCVCLQELCAAPGRACLHEFLLHLCVSVYKSFVTRLDVSANKSAGCNCRCSVESIFGLFRFVSKQFCLFRLFRYRYETPKQT
jgi:hypothetical protein